MEIADYDPRWPETFAGLRDQVADVVIASPAGLPEAITRLATLGYQHQGDLGITGREAFTSPAATPAHHLYVCTADSPELARHLAFRDYLRAHPGPARAYAQLKRSLAERFHTDRDAYSYGKTTFVEQALAAAADLQRGRPSRSRR